MLFGVGGCVIAVAAIVWLHGQFLAIAHIPVRTQKEYVGKVELMLTQAPPSDASLGDFTHMDTPDYTDTEIAVIRSPAILSAAVEDLKLHVRWKCGAQQAVERLRGQTDVSARKWNTLVISCRSNEAEHAAALASAIANAYREHRSLLDKKRSEAALESLEAALREQIKLVDPIP